MFKWGMSAFWHSTENLADAEKYMKDYPWLKEIHQEIAVLRQNPEEVLWMYSGVLRILDRSKKEEILLREGKKD